MPSTMLSVTSNNDPIMFLKNWTRSTMKSMLGSDKLTSKLARVLRTVPHVSMRNWDPSKGTVGTLAAKKFISLSNVQLNRSLQETDVEITLCPLSKYSLADSVNLTNFSRPLETVDNLLSSVSSLPSYDSNTASNLFWTELTVLRTCRMTLPYFGILSVKGASFLAVVVKSSMSSLISSKNSVTLLTNLTASSTLPTLSLTMVAPSLQASELVAVSPKRFCNARASSNLQNTRLGPGAGGEGAEGCGGFDPLQ
mmetsp:Transcript_19845/g.26203  ORF Transcript_19845/g.26203 Transcript_19845/m.26203 type:complete len:253 (-) Transcript_19845:514-1272(-)